MHFDPLDIFNLSIQAVNIGIALRKKNTHSALGWITAMLCYFVAFVVK